MSEVLDTIIASGPIALLAVTALLLLGWIGGVASREEVDKQRWADLSIAACLLAVPLVVLPLPRFLDPLVGTAVASGHEASDAAPIAVSSGPRRDPSGARSGAGNLGEDAVGPAGWKPVSSPDGAGALAPAVLPAASPLASPDSASPDSARGTGATLPRVLAGGFLILALCLGLRFAFGIVRLRRLVRRSHRVGAEQLPVELPERVTVLLGPNDTRPFCTGIFRAVIVIPRDLVRDPSFESVLRHELAHVQRGDARSQWLFAASMPLLFAHPLFWVLRSRARLSAEIVADAIASADRPTDYARRLLDFAERDVLRPVAPVGAVPVFRRRCELSRRIEMLADRNHRPSPRSSGASRGMRALGIAAMLTVVVGSMGAVPSAAQDPNRRWTKAERERILEKNAKLELLVEKLRNERASVAGVGATDPGAVVDPERKMGRGTRRIKVREGDSLYSLAKRYLGSGKNKYVERLLVLNPSLGADGSSLQVGQELVVPRRNWNSAIGLGSAVGGPGSSSSAGVTGFGSPGTTGPAGSSASGPVTPGPSGGPGIAGPGGGPGQPGPGAVSARNRPGPVTPGPSAMGGRDPLRASATRGGGGGGDRDSGQTLLLLIDRIVDARAELEIAEQRLVRFAKVGDEDEAAEARIRLRAAKRRYSLTREFAELELMDARRVLENSKAALEQAEALHKRGFLSNSELSSSLLRTERAESRIRVLQRALK